MSLNGPFKVTRCHRDHQEMCIPYNGRTLTLRHDIIINLEVLVRWWGVVIVRQTQVIRLAMQNIQHRIQNGDCDTENIVLLTHISRKDGEGESWLFIDASNLTRGSLKLDSNTLNSVTIHHLQAWYMYKHDTECI